jgi:hypothetical protein
MLAYPLDHLGTLGTSIRRVFPLKTVCSRDSDLTKGGSPRTGTGTSFLFHVCKPFQMITRWARRTVLRCPVRLLFRMAELPFIIVAAGLSSKEFDRKPHPMAQAAELPTDQGRAGEGEREGRQGQGERYKCSSCAYGAATVTSSDIVNDGTRGKTVPIGCCLLRIWDNLTMAPQ